MLAAKRQMRGWDPRTLHAIEGTSGDGAIDRGEKPWFEDDLGVNVQKLLRYGALNSYSYIWQMAEKPPQDRLKGLKNHRTIPIATTSAKSQR